MKADVYTSSDFRQMMNIENDELFKSIASYQSGEIEKSEITIPNNVSLEFNDDGLLLAINFKNVWNRSSLLISSTLSTLSEQKIICISDEQYNPPKEYDVSGYRKDFSISLFDRDALVELPIDGKDIIIIEMLLIAK